MTPMDYCYLVQGPTGTGRRPRRRCAPYGILVILSGQSPDEVRPFGTRVRQRGRDGRAVDDSLGVAIEGSVRGEPACGAFGLLVMGALALLA